MNTPLAEQGCFSAQTQQNNAVNVTVETFLEE